MTKAKVFENYQEFYQFYLSQHRHPVCRALHYVGTFLAVLIICYAWVSRLPILLLVAVLQGYLWAWIGHFVFEKNKPATFQYPFYSFISDWVMLKDFLCGKFRR